MHVRDHDLAVGYNVNDEELITDRHFGGGTDNMRDEFALHRDQRRAMVDRDPRVRDPRVERGERTHLDLASNSRHLVNSSSNYDDNADLIRDKETKERFAHRRDRDADYSPQHRSNRRVLNANAM